MGIYKLFFNKAASLYSETPEMNTGKDEILEIGSYLNNVGERAVVRSVVGFSKKELEDLLQNVVGEVNYSASLHLNLAEASEIPTDFTIQAYPLAQEWTNGTGKFNDTPLNDTGVSWEYRLSEQNGPWLIDNFPSNVTGSYGNLEPGGGAWFTELNGKEIEFNQEFELNDPLDVKVNVTDAIKSIISGSLPNNGFLLKLENDKDFGQILNTRLWFFSNETNSIYPPYLQIGWDDSVYTTGSLEELETTDIEVQVTNLKSEYREKEVERLRLRARPRFPKRRFSTSSIYFDEYLLPPDTQWGIKNENTEEMVVDFSEEFTKVSCDESGPFFDLYMQGLQPENYYRLLLKVPFNGLVKIYDKGNVFKVVRNGK